MPRSKYAVYPPRSLSAGRVRLLFWGRWVWDLGWVKRFLSPPPYTRFTGVSRFTFGLCNPLTPVQSKHTFRGDSNREEATFLRRGPEAAQRRAKEAQRRAREATRAAKASQNGDKRETKAKRGRWAKPFGYIRPRALAQGVTSCSSRSGGGDALG